MICVLHEADEEATTVKAAAVIYGLSVCEACLEGILTNVRAGSAYTADEYLTDAATGNWVSQ